MSSMFPVTFIGLEKIRLTHEINIAEAKRLEFYDKIKLAQQNYQEISDDYKKELKKIEELKLRSKKIGKISLCCKLIETCVEGIPQAVIIFCLLFVSYEHTKIQGWLIDTLDTQLLPYTVIFGMLAIKTVFGHVMTVSKIR